MTWSAATAPPPIAQLDLFGSKELRQLQAENEWLRGRLETAKEEFRKLRLERDTWKNGNDALLIIVAKRAGECTALQQKVARLQTAIRCLETTVTLLQSLTTAPQHAHTASLGRDHGVSIPPLPCPRKHKKSVTAC